jgi:hypothetical protein
MWTRGRIALWLAAIGVASIDARSLQMSSEAGVGSYWAIYDEEMGQANSTCLVAEGEMVAEECCTEAGELLAHEDVAGNYTCFELADGIVPFSGCVGDGIAGYGENCTGEGAPFDAMDAEECGCSFVIEGNGCYKANDIPGQQWFVYLDGGACAESTPSPSTSSGFGKQYATAVLLGLIVAAVL